MNTSDFWSWLKMNIADPGVRVGVLTASLIGTLLIWGTGLALGSRVAPWEIFPWVLVGVFISFVLRWRGG